MKPCPICQSDNSTILYEVASLPIFQNKVYSTVEEACASASGNVALTQCLNCNMVFNAVFNDKEMVYDKDYQNEQNHSPYFKKYLGDVLEIVQSLKPRKIVEIGCGKGYFLEMLQKHGFDGIGFDPAYEGDNPQIIQDYFSEKYCDIHADLFILRHTLEHVAQPADFLKFIAWVSQIPAQFLIEVPNFDWIKRKNSFWDVFYEHCNYFTEASLSYLIKSPSCHRVFNEQYIIATGELRQNIPPKSSYALIELQFQQRFLKAQDYLSTYRKVAIWGAGAKGSTFVNLLDKQKEKILFVVDINPKKKGKFIAGTGHLIKSPQEVDFTQLDLILVMNENYIREIRSMVTTANLVIEAI